MLYLLLLIDILSSRHNISPLSISRGNNFISSPGRSPLSHLSRLRTPSSADGREFPINNSISNLQSQLNITIYNKSASHCRQWIHYSLACWFSTSLQRSISRRFWVAAYCKHSVDGKLCKLFSWIHLPS